MPLSFPTFQEIVDRTRSDVAASLPGVDPTLENSLLDAIVTSFSSRISDVYSDLTRLLREKFPQTATGEFLDLDGEVFGVPRLQASKSNGNAIFQGTVGTSIPSFTEFSSLSGQLYESTASVNINTVNLSVLTLTRSGTIATATFSSDHGLSTGMTVTISGAVQTQYNGAFTITVISSTSIEYTVSGSPVTPATGTINLYSDYATVPVRSKENGIIQNLSSGARLNLTTTIVGVNSQGFVTFNGLTGGADIEDDERYRERIIDERSNLEALFDEAQIRQRAFTVPGVTRLKVKKIFPTVGQVTILFLRDDDTDSIIPSPGEVQDVKNAIIDQIPAHVDSNDVIVQAPTPITVNFDFTSLSPDTPELRASILSNLQAFFREEVDFEQSISQDKYRGVIATSVDPSTGGTVDSFTLSTPIGPVAVSASQIAVLGTVSFSV